MTVTTEEARRHEAIKLAWAAPSPTSGIDSLLANAKKIEEYLRGDSK